MLIAGHHTECDEYYEEVISKPAESAGPEARELPVAVSDAGYEIEGLTTLTTLPIRLNSTRDNNLECVRHIR